jgi:hypothetical protein
MNTLIERLRIESVHPTVTVQMRLIAIEASDAIEALQSEVERLKAACDKFSEAEMLGNLKGAEPVAWLIEYEYLASSTNIGGSLKKFKENWRLNSFVSEFRNAEIDAKPWRNRKETPLYAAPQATAPTGEAHL